MYRAACLGGAQPRGRIRTHVTLLSKINHDFSDVSFSHACTAHDGPEPHCRLRLALHRPRCPIGRTSASVGLQSDDYVRPSALAAHASGAAGRILVGLTLVSTNATIIVAHRNATVVAIGLARGRWWGR
jgi:hypothetical protein